MTNNWGNDGRLTARCLKTSAAVNRSLLQYAYDNDDNITGITDGVTPANNITYAHDVRGRLSRTTLATTSGAPYKRTDWLYDANGNRTAAERRVNATDTTPAQTDTYTRTSGTNRLASLTSFAGTRSFTYDNRGNLSIETRGPAVTATTAYDGHGRLTSYSRSGDPSFVHGYNGLGDRTSTTTTPAGGGNADTRRFVTDSYGRVIGEYGASASDVKAEFIWMNPIVGEGGMFGGNDGLGGYMPAAVATAGGTITYVHGNHLGVPIIYTDGTGASVAAPTGYSAPGFPGQSRTLADLYYNRYRDYDPTTGRYIQADPIGLAGGQSPYLYADANPVRYTDPTGLCPPCLAALAAGALVVAGYDYWLWNYGPLSDLNPYPAKTYPGGKKISPPISPSVSEPPYPRSPNMDLPALRPFYPSTPANDNDRYPGEMCPFVRELPENECIPGNRSCIYKCPSGGPLRIEQMSRTFSCRPAILPHEGDLWTPRPSPRRF